MPNLVHDLSERKVLEAGSLFYDLRIGYII